MVLKTLASILFLVIFAPQTCMASEAVITHVKGVALEVSTSNSDISSDDVSWLGSGDTQETQNIKTKVLSGKDENKIIEIVNQLDGSPFDINVEKGDKLFLYSYTRDGVTEYSIRDIWHLDMLIFWSIILFVLVLILGKWQGFKSLFTLGVSLFLIFSIFIPRIRAGSSPIITAVIISLIVSIITLPLIHGFSRKAVVSIIGTIGGISVAYLFSEVIMSLSKINGLGSESIRLFAIDNSNYNFEGILFAGIIIGALGAIMDVAVSISSGLQEVRLHNPNIKYKELIFSGMNIGRDIMGSMLNTLIFAYVGASIATILIISQNDISMMEFLNYDFVVEEIIRAIIGSIGLVATIPLTSVIAGLLHKKL